MKDKLLSLFTNALQALNPYDSVARAFKDEALQIDGTSLSLNTFSEIYLLAMGKASTEMARAAMERSEVKPENMLVVCPKDSDIPETMQEGVIEAEHPVPGAGSEKAGKAVIEFLEAIPKQSLLICCISGGTSSLLVKPAGGISLEDLNSTHELLLNSGADIHEMNAVRKHLSQVKGGQLLRHLNKKTTLVNLVISDVPGDDPAVIGSGPTVPDSSTFIEASKVLGHYGLWEKVPESVRKHIKKGMSGNAPETVKAVEVESYTRIVASAKMLADAVGEKAGQDAGFRMQDAGSRMQDSGFRIQDTGTKMQDEESELELKVEVADEPFTGDVELVASDIARRAKEVAESDGSPCLLVYFGESKVKVTGEGKGGRNQELALRGARKIEGHDNITWLSIGTDGIDGPTDAAGAVVDGTTIAEAREKGLDPEEYLQRNDSYHFHEQLGTLVKIGPTGNNLMDLTLVVIG